MREQDSRAASDEDHLPGHVLEVLGLELGRGETHTVLRLCPRLLLRLQSPRVGTEEERDTPENRTLKVYIHTRCGTFPGLLPLLGINHLLLCMGCQDDNTGAGDAADGKIVAWPISRADVWRK